LDWANPLSRANASQNILLENMQDVEG